MSACVSAAVIASALLAHTGAARAQDAVVRAPQDREVDEVVVTLSKGKATDVAPVSSSLLATEPEAVITRKFIEESAPRVGDYTTSAVLAPSLATFSNPNGPGSTDGGKLTLRGFQDGEYNTTYDGIAWGDTNGPSHHANSFFPSSTIGGIVVDRGPGGATALGQANFGGQVNLFSLPFEDHFGGRQTVTAGSFGVWQAVTTLASGPISKLNGANVVLNFMEYSTDGYLSNSASEGQNQFIKVEVPITSRLKVTGLYTHNYDQYYQNDANSTADVAQNAAYGRRFALSNDPTLQTYYKYNQTKKKTDFEYIKADLALDHGVSLQDTVYSYYYNNRTVSANDGTADNTLGAAGLAAANQVTLNPTGAYPAAGKAYTTGVTTGPGHLPGYLKRNQYRVTGNIAEADAKTAYGDLTMGLLYEAANTQRSRFDIDLITRAPNYAEKAAVYPAGLGCPYLPVISAPGKTNNGACQEPLNVAYLEYSGWRQFQPFIQFAWKPLPALTITPGFKYINFDLFVHAPALAIKNSIQPVYISQTFTKPLFFLTGNYRVRPDLAVYAQYAQGFLVPNVSAFYTNTPGKPIVPQQSTNYQLGGVYAAGKLTFDADIYYITFKNKIQTINDPTLAGETYETNSGGAIYKGIEAEGTYVLGYGFSVFGNGSLNSAKGDHDPTNPFYNDRQLGKAPFWTAATGARLERRHIFAGADDFVATVNTKWIGQQYQTAAAAATPTAVAMGPTALIKSWSETNFSGTYRIGRYAIEAQILNLLDGGAVTAFKGKVVIPGTNVPAATVAQGGAANLFTYEAGRSVQITIKADF